MPRENQVTVDVGPRLRAKMDEAKSRAGEFDDPVKDADIVRDALKLWAKEAPYALDRYEMWMLRASRATRRANPRMWARALRMLSGRFGEIGGVEMEPEAYGELAQMAGEGPNGDDDSGEVRATRRRKAS